jgi:hypothetical protein
MPTTWPGSPSHRHCSFTLDETNFGRFMRLFVGEPVWTPYNRKDPGVSGMPAVTAYLQSRSATVDAVGV